MSEHSIYYREPETRVGRVRERLGSVVNDHIKLATLGPALLAIFLVFLYPVVYLVYWSLYMTVGPITRFAPLYNYQQMIQDPSFLQFFQNTLVYSVSSLVISLLGGLVVALAINKVTSVRGRNTYATLVLLSWAIPLAVTGLIWKWLLNGQIGLVNQILVDLGVFQRGYSWLANGTSAMASVILADAWSRMPFATVILLAGLQSIPDQMYDAAKVDGATTFEAFRHVTLPYLRPSIFVAGFINWMFAFRAFSIVFSLTGGGPGNATEVLSIYIYRKGMVLFNFGFAAAVSLFLVLVTLVVAALYVRFVLERPEGDN